MMTDGEETGATMACEERDVDIVVPEAFAERDDINTDGDDAVVMLAILESLLVDM